LVVLQLLVGVLNLALLTPIGMQILHLLLADLLWIALVVLCAC
jgi:cytochrome c oxidase assembly protein subunit 15